MAATEKKKTNFAAGKMLGVSFTFSFFCSVICFFVILILLIDSNSHDLFAKCLVRFLDG